MGFSIERNTSYGKLPELEFSGNPGPTVPLIGRIFIDIGIAIATIGAGILTGGTAIPAIAPTLVGSVTALTTNTAIDVGEGRTDATTLGLDIGLPFATEALGTLISVISKEVTLSVKAFERLSKNQIIASSVGFEGQRRTINNLKRALQESAEYHQNIVNVVEKEGTGISASQEGLNQLKQNVKNIENIEKNVGNTFKSVTDLLDKVTGSLRAFLERLLPRLSKVIKELRKYIRSLRNSLTKAANPFFAAKAQVESKVKSILKNVVSEENNIKIRMNEAKARYAIRKQSMLQNALIAKYNIQKVDSRWVLGFSLVNKELDDDGVMTKGDLIWWFIPEATKHNGERGAVPEPYGKRPVGMLGINQAQFDYILKESSKGRFYLNNVANGKSSTNLFGPGGIQLQDLNKNFISRLFKNALSIIPGYSLYMDINQTIGQFQTLTDKIVSNELGTDFIKGLESYNKYAHEYGSKLLPKDLREPLNAIYNNDKYDGSDALKSFQEISNRKLTNVSNNGVVMHVKPYKKK